ncbi:hypothetical protein [Aeromonas media]|uniref:hypothetical protein n=1 Tax=Aeromonas media TaxID=651 RepID=UPI003D1B128F
MNNSSFAENNQFLLSLPIGRTLLKHICTKGLPDSTLSNDEWVMARNIERYCRGLMPKVRGQLNGPAIKIEKIPSSEADFLIQFLSKSEMMTDEKFKRELVMLRLIFTENLSAAKEKAILRDEKIKKKANSIATVTAGGCVDLFKRISAEIPSNWAPALKLNWDVKGQGKTPGKRDPHYAHPDDCSDEIYVDMTEILSQNKQLISKIYMEDRAFDANEVIGGFRSDKWEMHLVAATCHAASHAAQWRSCGHKSLTKDDEHNGRFLFFYSHARNFLCNPSLKEARIRIGYEQDTPGPI